jgi:hypothetical protein
MFGRQVTMKLKPGSGWEFIRLNQTLVSPILREQQGFLSETMHFNPEHSEVIVNSLWDTKEDEASYDKTAYLEMVKLLADVVEGTPMVKTFELAATHCHKVAA